VDSDLIEQKLESLRRCVRRIQDKCPATPELLEADLDAQDILSLNLTRAVQLCVDIATHLIADSDAVPPDTMGQSFERLVEQGLLTPELGRRMRAAVGFRNLAVHEYDAINWEIVHHLAHHRLDDFRAYAQAVSQQLPG